MENEASTSSQPLAQEDKWYEYIARHPRTRALFGIDLRALAVFRMALAILLLVDLFVRSRYLTAHYSDAGVLPRGVLNEQVGGIVASLYMINGSAWFAAFLFLVTAAIAVMLLVGYKTEIMIFACWVMVISLHNRNPLLLNAGDNLLCLLLFWSLFLPIGACGSVDGQATNKKQRPAKLVFSMATVAVLVQVVSVYFFTALFKNNPIWHTDGTALYYALSLDNFATHFGKEVLTWPPELLEFLSKSAYWLERGGWLLAFVPFWTARLRVVTVAMFLSLHVGIALTLNVGLFSYVSMAAWIVFLPAPFWDWLLRASLVRSCANCWNNLMGRLARYAASLGHRFSAAKSAPEAETSYFEDFMVAVLLTFVLWYNVGTVAPSFSVPKPLSALGNALRLLQEWKMFAPFPSYEDGWYVVPAQLEDGTEVDLYSGNSPVRWTKPEHLPDLIPTQRWNKYLNNVWNADSRHYVPHYAAYLRRDWNARHEADQHVKSMDVIMRLEYTLPPPRAPFLSRQRMYWWESGGKEQTITYEENRVNLVNELQNARLDELQNERF